MYKNTLLGRELFRSLVSIKRHYVNVKSKFMKSWQLFEYGGVNKLVLGENVPIPSIVRPSDVLVEVKAASVNPIDNKMINGYGSAAIRELRRISSLDLNHPEFPLTLGRDFAGTIVDRGTAVEPGFKINDEVWGTMNVGRQGTFSQYILVSSKDIWHKPPSLSSTEAASIPYVASTLWNALSPVCNHVGKEAFEGKKVLVLGGSGGVGSFAIQFFNGYGAEVTTTAAADFVSKATDLGACNVIDYSKHDASFLVAAHGRYDLILDLINTEKRSSLLKHLNPPSPSSSDFTFPPQLTFLPRYITINFPFFSNVSRHGLVLGALKSASQFALEFAQGIQHGSLVTWGAYAPSKKALQAVHEMVEDDKVRAVVEKVYPFEELPQALTKLSVGHNRGKTIVDYEL